MEQIDIEQGELGRARVRSLRGRQSKLRASKPQQEPGGLFAPRQISLLGD